MPEQSNDYRVVVLGAGGVGKSSLVLRFVKGTFSDAYVPTVEDTYREVMTCTRNIYTLEITDTTGSHQFPAMMRLNISKGHAFILVYSVTSRQSLEELLPIRRLIGEVKITDTTGSHQFPAMMRLNISKGHAFILVYSVTSRQSLEELLPIRRLIGEVKGSVQDLPMMLVGNKTDEEESREVPTTEGTSTAEKWSCNFMETSAKTNSNVKEMFQELLNMEKSRNVALHPEKKSMFRKDKLKGKCRIM